MKDLATRVPALADCQQLLKILGEAMGNGYEYTGRAFIDWVAIKGNPGNRLVEKTELGAHAMCVERMAALAEELRDTRVLLEMLAKMPYPKGDPEVDKVLERVTAILERSK